MNFHGIVWKYFMKICSVIPLQNKIVFSSFDGQAYSDNPREIYEYMRSAYKDKVKFVWIMNEETDIDGAKVVRNYSFASVYQRNSFMFKHGMEMYVLSGLKQMRKRLTMNMWRMQNTILKWQIFSCLEAVGEVRISRMLFGTVVRYWN